MSKYILLDIGGTAIKYGLLEEEGEVLLYKNQTPTEAEKGGAKVQEKVMDLISSLLLKSRPGAIAGVAISSAGMVDTGKGIITQAGHTMPGYAGTAFKKPIEEKFQLPCSIENDVNCAGYAEYKAGAAKGAESMLCLTVGTGIGGCAVVNGHILSGFSGGGCEVGYMSMRGSTFEKLGAASVLSRMVAEDKREDVKKWDGIHIFEGAYNGDSVCMRRIDEMCDVLGEGIANICYVLNPEVVVLGGGIMAQKEYLYPRIREAIDHYLIPALAEKTALKMAQLGNDAGMMGAYYHFCDEYQSK